ncbi:MAG: hypothetical protein ACXV4A_08750 [Actinomycetes bacterium]
MSLGAVPTIVLLTGIVLCAAWYLSFSAARLDRLHARVEGARSALDAQLVRRASVSLQLATSGLLDPATALLLADAAHEARESVPGDREVAESDLTKALQAAFADPDLVRALERDPRGRDLLRELGASCQRVQLARRFVNDAVRATRVVRRKWVVRSLRLAGHAGWPQTFEMDDSLPITLVSDKARPGSNTTL